jgi:hypothetical protein
MSGGSEKMAYFKVVVKGGHMGAGKSYDMVRYYKAQDMLSAFTGALSLSRVKKDPNGTAVFSIEPIVVDEYYRGKKMERRDPYLNHRRMPKAKKGCSFQK